MNIFWNHPKSINKDKVLGEWRSNKLGEGRAKGTTFVTFHKIIRVFHTTGRASSFGRKKSVHSIKFSL